jgi:predicted nucleotidyltransferase
LILPFYTAYSVPWQGKLTGQREPLNLLWRSLDGITILAVEKWIKNFTCGSAALCMIKEKRLPPQILTRIPGLIEALRACDDVTALFFFGSLGRGELKPLSDLDLGVLLKGNSVKEKMFDRQLDLMEVIARELGTDEFDLIILNTAPLRFAYHILKSGEKVFVKDQRQLGDFHENVVKKYLDFRYYRREFDRSFLRGMRLRG